MYHRLQTLESDKKLQKFKKGLIDALKCIKIRHGRFNRECLCHQEDTESCQQKPHKVLNLSKHKEPTDSKTFLIKQRNSFPCSSSAAKKSINLGSIFDKEEIEKTYVTKNSKSTLQQDKLKSTAGFHKIMNLHRNMESQNQHDENQFSIFGIDPNGKQAHSRERLDRATQIKRRKLKAYLHIDKKLIGCREDRVDFNRTVHLRPSKGRELGKKDSWKATILNSEPCEHRLYYQEYVQELSRWSSTEEGEDTPHFYA